MNKVCRYIVHVEFEEDIEPGVNWTSSTFFESDEAIVDEEIFAMADTEIDELIEEFSELVPVAATVVKETVETEELALLCLKS